MSLLKILTLRDISQKVRMAISENARDFPSERSHQPDFYCFQVMRLSYDFFSANHKSEIL